MVRFWVMVKWVLTTGYLSTTTDVVCINPKKYGDAEIVAGETILIRKKGRQARMAKVLEIAGDKSQLLDRQREINANQHELRRTTRLSESDQNRIIVSVPNTERANMPPRRNQQVFIDEGDNVIVVEQNRSEIYERGQLDIPNQPNVVQVERQEPHNCSCTQNHQKEVVYVDEDYSDPDEKFVSDGNGKPHSSQAESIVQSNIRSNLNIVPQRRTVYIDEEAAVKDQDHDERDQRNVSILPGRELSNGLNNFMSNYPSQIVFLDEGGSDVEYEDQSNSKRNRLSQQSSIYGEFQYTQKLYPTPIKHFENRAAAANSPGLSDLNKYYDLTRAGKEYHRQLSNISCDLYGGSSSRHEMMCSTPMPKFVPNEYMPKINQAQQTDQQDNSKPNSLLDETEKLFHILSNAFCELSKSTTNRDREALACFPREILDKMAYVLGPRMRMNANDTNNSTEVENQSSSESVDVSMSSMNASAVDEMAQAKSPRVRRVSAQSTTVEDKMVPIGNGNAHVPAKLMEEIDWTCYSSATKQLLKAAFPRRVLATHSLTGKRFKESADKYLKKFLDPKLVEDIVITVSQRCGVLKSLVRQIITIKCLDEAKLYKCRLDRRVHRGKENHPTTDDDDSEVSSSENVTDAGIAD